MRIRTVKPEFWSHPVMGRLQPEARLLALALLNYADDEGYFLAEATLIRSACCPFMEDYGTITVMIRLLIAAEWVEISWDDIHGPIGRVVSFNSHQVVNHPRASKLKQYWGIPYEYGNPPVKIPESSGNVTTRNGMEWNGKEQGKERAEFSGDEPEGDDMGKKSTALQQDLISPALMANPDFMEAWTAFLDMRKTIKRPATDYAQKLLLKKLWSLTGNNPAEAILILEQSIVKCWQDIFPVKAEGFQGKSGQGGGGGDRPDLDFIVTGTD